MEKIKKPLFYFCILSALLSVGFYRDFLFKKINALLQAWDHDIDFEMPGSLRFFEGFEYDTVVNIKWLLTLLFSLLYLGIALITVKYVFKEKKYLLITIFAYLFIILLSGLFITSGMVFDKSSEKMYEFARYFMGMAQSPIVLMILIPLFKLSEKEKNKSSV